LSIAAPHGRALVTVMRLAKGRNPVKANSIDPETFSGSKFLRPPTISAQSWGRGSSASVDGHFPCRVDLATIGASRPTPLAFSASLSPVAMASASAGSAARNRDKTFVRIACNASVSALKTKSGLSFAHLPQGAAAIIGRTYWRCGLRKNRRAVNRAALRG
jgi:hypothetical protein